MKKFIPLMLLALILSSCSVFRPHKKDINQGNVITPAEVKRLHKGMSKSEVKKVMGNPVMVTIFEDNRLNYVYTMKRGYNPMAVKRVICVFDKGRLVDIYKN